MGLGQERFHAVSEVVDRQAVLTAYGTGITAIDHTAGDITDWRAATPCGVWNVGDLVGHLLAIVRYYHRLLDSALTGTPLADLPLGRHLAAMNAEDLVHLPESEGAERLQRFLELAADLLRRLQEVDWNLDLGTWAGLGVLTIGEHTGVAVGEWHVHAWDLSRAIGVDHRPGDALTVARGQRAVLRQVGPGDPWTEVLRGYGRDPDWARSGRSGASRRSNL
jgi:uncharacterized protein (TIGR03083 family)